MQCPKKATRTSRFFSNFHLFTCFSPERGPSCICAITCPAMGWDGMVRLAAGGSAVIFSFFFCPPAETLSLFLFIPHIPYHRTPQLAFVKSGHVRPKEEEEEQQQPQRLGRMGKAGREKAVFAPSHFAFLSFSYWNYSPLFSLLSFSFSWLRRRKMMSVPARSFSSSLLFGRGERPLRPFAGVVPLLLEGISGFSFLLTNRKGEKKANDPPFSLHRKEAILTSSAQKGRRKKTAFSATRDFRFSDSLSCTSPLFCFLPENK